MNTEKLDRIERNVVGVIAVLIAAIVLLIVSMVFCKPVCAEGKHLAWEPPMRDGVEDTSVLGYVMYYKNTVTSTENSIVLPPDAREFSMDDGGMNLLYGIPYQFAITAFNSAYPEAGESERSNTVQGTRSNVVPPESNILPPVVLSRPGAVVIIVKIVGD